MSESERTEVLAHYGKPVGGRPRADRIAGLSFHNARRAFALGYCQKYLRTHGERVAIERTCERWNVTPKELHAMLMTEGGRTRANLKTIKSNPETFRDILGEDDLCDLFGINPQH